MSIERVLLYEREENAMKVMYWSDYACPYCYIGKTHLKKAIENLNLGDQVDVKMLAFELDPKASKEYTGATVDRFARKYGLSLKGAQERIDGISEMGRAAGLDFHYAETRYTNTTGSTDFGGASCTATATTVLGNSSSGFAGSIALGGSLSSVSSGLSG